MSTVLSASSPAAGAKAHAMPSLCASPSFKHYRRSTTNRAPRKRTFLLTMTKYNVDIATPPGIASAFANNVAMLSLGPCYRDEAALFGGDGSGGFRGNRRNTGGNSDGWGSDGDDAASWRFAPVLSRALLGAVAIVAAVAAFPAQSRAMMQQQQHQQQGGSLSTSTSSSSIQTRSSGHSGHSPTDSLLGSSAPTRGSFFPQSSSASSASSVPTFGRNSSPGAGPGPSPSSGSSRPRSKVMHVSCKGSTLVVPLTGKGDGKAAAPRLGPWQRAKIVDAPIELSGNEAAVLELPQYRVRESMLV